MIDRRTLRRLPLLALFLLAGQLPLAQAQDGALIDPDELNIEEDEFESGAWPGGTSAFADRPYEVSQEIGVVAEMDAAGPFVLVNGVRYGFVADAEVRLRAGFGAPTLIQPGMVLEFYYAETLQGAIAGNIVAAIELEDASAFAE